MSVHAGATCAAESAFKTGATFRTGSGGPFLARCSLPARFAFGTWAAVRAGTTFAGRPAFAFAIASAVTFTGRHRGAELLPADLAVAILVEGFQGSGGIGDFLSANLSILIGIQRCQQRRHGTAAFRPPRATGAARTGTTGSISALLLGLNEHGTGGEGQSNDDLFHGVCFWFGLKAGLQQEKIPRRLLPWHPIVKILCLLRRSFVKSM